MNKVMLMGNLGRDPELRYTTKGDAVCNLSIATSYRKGDNKQTEWHKVVLFGKLAEIAGEHLAKGRQVLLEGRIQTRKWQDKNGEDRYSTEIVATEMEFISGKRDESRVTVKPEPATDEPQVDFDDEIPF